MGKKIIVLFLCFSTVVNAQDFSLVGKNSRGSLKGEVFKDFTSLQKYNPSMTIDYRTGTLKATGSLYKANMLNNSISHYYVGGNAEYFFSNNYSFRGDIYSLVGEKNSPYNSMLKTKQLSAGFNRHFLKKPLSPFIGVYTGVTQLHMNSLLETFAPDFNHPSVQYIPHVGISIGFQYYFYKYCHFFAEARYIHQLNPYQPTSLDEISYSAGLGFQIFTGKRK